MMTKKDVPTKRIDKETPYEMWTGKWINIEQDKILLCQSEYTKDVLLKFEMSQSLPNCQSLLNSAINLVQSKYIACYLLSEIQQFFVTFPQVQLEQFFLTQLHFEDVDIDHRHFLLRNI